MPADMIRTQDHAQEQRTAVLSCFHHLATVLVLNDNRVRQRELQLVDVECLVETARKPSPQSGLSAQ
jgi:hypothetical protein